MKKRILLMIGFYLLVIATPILAAGGTHVKTWEIRGLFWEDQAKAIDHMMRSWCNGGTRAEMISTIKDLLQVESGLLAYGTDFNDKRLYSRLGRDVGSTEVERFVGLVFSQRMTDLGFAPRSAQTTFAGRQFLISRPGSSDTERINFE